MYNVSSSLRSHKYWRRTRSDVCPTLQVRRLESTYVCVYMHVYVCIYTHVYMHVYTHVYMHVYTQRGSARPADKLGWGLPNSNHRLLEAHWVTGMSGNPTNNPGEHEGRAAQDSSAGCLVEGWAGQR